MKVRKRLRVFSTALFVALLFVPLGLAAGILYSVGGFFIDLLVSLNWITSSETPGLSFGTILAFQALIGMPLIAGAFGFIAGFVSALLYNIGVAWWFKANINVWRESND